MNRGGYRRESPKDNCSYLPRQKVSENRRRCKHTVLDILELKSGFPTPSEGEEARRSSSEEAEVQARTSSLKFLQQKAKHASPQASDFQPYKPGRLKVRNLIRIRVEDTWFGHFWVSGRLEIEGSAASLADTFGYRSIAFERCKERTHLKIVTKMLRASLGLVSDPLSLALPCSACSRSWRGC